MIWKGDVMEFVKEMLKDKKEIMKHRKYDSGNDSLRKKWLRNEITQREYLDELAKKRGYEDNKDYTDKWLESKGFKDWREYERYCSHKRGDSLPLSESKDTSLYLGVYIAENILSEIFENVTKMDYGFSGYDVICKRNYKIDVKSSCFNKREKRWIFTIRKNKLADYFLLIAFDNRENLEIKHMWLIGANEVVKRRKLNEFHNFTIMNRDFILNNLLKYEIIDKINKANDMCNRFKKVNLND